MKLRVTMATTAAERERKAMETIAAALGSLDNVESRRRVLQWVDDCFHSIDSVDHHSSQRPRDSVTPTLATSETADLTVEGVDEFFDGPSSAVISDEDAVHTDADAWFELAEAEAAADSSDETLVRVNPVGNGPLDSLVRDLASDLQRFAEVLQQPA